MTLSVLCFVRFPRESLLIIWYREYSEIKNSLFNSVLASRFSNFIFKSTCFLKIFFFALPSNVVIYTLIRKIIRTFVNYVFLSSEFCLCDQLTSLNRACSAYAFGCSLEALTRFIFRRYREINDLFIILQLCILVLYSEVKLTIFETSGL